MKEPHIGEDMFGRPFIMDGSKPKHVDVGHILTIAGVIITAAASFITSEQQKQSNHEIAKEVADILRAEMRNGGEF